MANLEAGVRLVHAAHFHQTRPWLERVRINSGVVIEGGRVLPRDDWRIPTAEEIALLTTGDAAPGDELALFNVPKRLCDQWWSLGADQDAAAFDGYAGEVLEYLEFKQLPLPRRCAISVVVSSPGVASTRPDAGGLTAVPALAGMVAGINLGDEEAAMLFINVRGGNAR